MYQNFKKSKINKRRVCTQTLANIQNESDSLKRLQFIVKKIFLITKIINYTLLFTLIYLDNTNIYNKLCMFMQRQYKEYKN